MPYTPEQEFGEMTLSDYDSNEDADYEPSESEDSDDELEFNSDASISEDSEVEDEEEEPVKEDARILELFIYLTLVLSCRCLPQRSDILLNDSIVHRKTF